MSRVYCWRRARAVPAWRHFGGARSAPGAARRGILRRDTPRPVSGPLRHSGAAWRVHAASPERAAPHTSARHSAPHFPDLGTRSGVARHPGAVRRLARCSATPRNIWWCREGRGGTARDAAAPRGTRRCRDTILATHSARRGRSAIGGPQLGAAALPWRPRRMIPACGTSPGIGVTRGRSLSLARSVGVLRAIGPG